MESKEQIMKAEAERQYPYLDMQHFQNTQTERAYNTLMNEQRDAFRNGANWNAQQTATLQAECERLREVVELASAGLSGAVGYLKHKSPASDKTIEYYYSIINTASEALKGKG